MAVSKVYVEIGDDGLPTRIIRDHAEVWRMAPENVAHWPKADAVREIRFKVLTRSNGECEFCGRRVIWRKGEMHEVVFRSQGGEVSVANSVFICGRCHQEAHGIKVK